MYTQGKEISEIDVTLAACKKTTWTSV